jgi:hypothetical protein
MANRNMAQAAYTRAPEDGVRICRSTAQMNHVCGALTNHRRPAKLIAQVGPSQAASTDDLLRHSTNQRNLWGREQRHL